MKRSLSRFIAGLIPASLLERLLMLKYGYASTISYSQHGEDMLIRDKMAKKSDGFYVDVGAHHPVRFSNTFALYRRGWRGINIDATPGSMEPFRRMRPRDINIEAAISEIPHDMDLYIFKKPSLNTLSKESALDHESRGISPIGTRQIRSIPLREILSAHLPAHTIIDLMSIDVEGLDLEILKSNDWSRFAPRFIMIEDWQFDPEKPEASAISRYLHDREYRIAGWVEGSILYEHS